MQDILVSKRIGNKEYSLAKEYDVFQEKVVLVVHEVTFDEKEQRVSLQWIDVDPLLQELLFDLIKVDNG